MAWQIMCKRSLDVNIGQLCYYKLLLRTMKRRTHKIHFSYLAMSQREDFPASEECEAHFHKHFTPHSECSRRLSYIIVICIPVKYTPGNSISICLQCLGKANCSCSGFHFGGEVSCQALCYSISYLLQFALQF